MALSQLCHAELPRRFWADAVSTACYIRNRLPVCPLNISPYERWHDKKPNVKHMRVFVCVAYALKPDSERSKMDPKSEKLKFIGYPSNVKGYRLYDEKKRRVIVRRDVIFNEADFCAHRSGDNTVTATDGSCVLPSTSELETPESDTVQKPEPVRQSAELPDPSLRRSQLEAKKPNRYGEWVEDDASINKESLVVANEHLSDVGARHCLYFVNVCEPRTIDEALRSPESAEWKQAADAEYDSLIENYTWELVPLPDGRSVVGCKWVFQVKLDSNRRIQRFKGRLVAKGYSQKHGIDYDETFSPVVRFSSIRTLLAFAVQRGVLIHQMDAVTAFLNDQLEEEIYMQQLPGYVEEGQEELVCKLKKSLYGLKQSPRCWNMTFRQYMR